MLDVEERSPKSPTRGIYLPRRSQSDLRTEHQPSPPQSIRASLGRSLDLLLQTLYSVYGPLAEPERADLSPDKFSSSMVE
ncbi:hypothetical protein VTN02DRAFT_3830 [Thermoascus thermophilus]